MTLIYAAISLVLIGVMGITAVDIGAADADITSNAVDLAQAEYNSTAGMEWAKWRLNNGEDPRSLTPLTRSFLGRGRTLSAIQRYTFGPTEFGDGTFEVTSDPDNGSVTSVGKSGAATVSHTMYPTYASECFEFFGTPDFNFPPGTQGSMDGVGFRLHCPEDCEASDSCLDTLIIKAMEVSWTKAKDQQTVTAIIVDKDGAGEFVSYNQNSANGYSIAGTPSTGAVSGTTINTVDYELDDNEDHYFSTFEFQYSPGGFQPESPDNFTITVFFKDGTTESVTYSYVDSDGDGIPDSEDTDDDGDGTPDVEDPDCTGLYCDKDCIDDTDGDGDCDCYDDGSCVDEEPDDCTGKFCDPIIIVIDPEDEGPMPSIEGGIDPCRIPDDMGAEGGDGCASDGDGADNPGDSYGDGCQTCGPGETPP